MQGQQETTFLNVNFVNTKGKYQAKKQQILVTHISGWFENSKNR